MIRNLKALGLSLVVLAAMSAMGAVSASANPATFTAGVGPIDTAKWDGGQIGTDTTTVGTVPAKTCKKATFFGRSLTAGPKSTEITLEPKYEECHVVIAGLTKLVTVTMNGCAFKLNATKETNGVAFSADLTIECPKIGEVTQKIETHVYNSATSEAETLCTFDIEAQGPLAGITLDNKTNTPGIVDDIVMTMDLTIAATNTITKAPCPTAASVTETYKGEDTLQATNANLVDAVIS